jgi:hypothetical protein
MALSATISALLAGRTVRCAHLVELCFATQARRIWNGSYKITTSDGHDWFGLNKLLGIEGLEHDGDGQSSELRVTVSGADARFLALAISADESEYMGRHIKIYNQFFEGDRTLLDEPQARAAGIIDGIGVTRSPRDPNGTRRTITINAQNMFYGRGQPPASYYTDSDQQLRFPGDRGLQYIAALQDTNIPFPW